MYDVGTINNLAGSLWDLQGDNNYVARNGSPGTYVINNAGTFRKSAGTGTSWIEPCFNNTGTVEVDNGTLEIDNGSSNAAHYEFANGGRLNASLMWQGENTVNGNGVLAVGGNVAAGTTATFASSQFTNGAGLEIGAGATGDLNVGTGATLNLNMTGSRQATMASGYLHGAGTTINQGNFAWSGGNIGGDGTGVVVNQGNFTWTGGTINGNLTNISSQFTISGSGGQAMQGGGALTNAGTITQMANTQVFVSGHRFDEKCYCASGVDRL
jgi:hypothetical protein